MQGFGGTITDSGSNRIHTFASSGTFDFIGSGTVKLLVVGGGDGWGGWGQPGGGAGQFIYTTSHSISSGSYAVTINGAGATSVFHGVTANRGTGGTSGNGYGSGSVGCGRYGCMSGGGGGSAGGGSNAHGGPGDYVTAGDGGPGTACDITGTSLVYACGGPGGYASGGSFLPGGYGSRLYGDGGGGLPGVSPLGGVVIISYAYSEMDSGLRIGGQKIAYEPLVSTHKLRFNRSGTIVGIPLMDPGSSMSSKCRIYDGSSVKTMIVVP